MIRSGHASNPPKDSSWPWNLAADLAVELLKNSQKPLDIFGEILYHVMAAENAA